MKPRQDQIGVILTRDEADLAVKLDDAERECQRLSGTDTILLATRIDIDLSDTSDEFILDDKRTQRLLNVASWAASMYLAGYMEVAATYDEICQTDDITRNVVAEYLSHLEVLMHVESDRFRAAKQIADDVEKNHIESQIHASQQMV
jgi:hypothetical protein